MLGRGYFKRPERRVSLPFLPYILCYLLLSVNTQQSYNTIEMFSLIARAPSSQSWLLLYDCNPRPDR